MAERRAKGLCYNCDGKYIQGSQCKRLFWLEMDDWDDSKEAIETLEETILLNAITVNLRAKTI